jgi:Glycosyltransferase family 87
MLLSTFGDMVIGSQSRLSRYARLLGFMTIYLFGLLLISYLRWQRLTDYSTTAALYHRYSLNVIEGQTPYRDFSLDYPPLALLPIVLPQLINPGITLAEYAWLFLFENAVISVLLGLAVVSIASSFLSWRRCLGVLAVYSLLSTVIAPLLLGRYDLFPTLLVAIAVAAAIGGHPTQAGVWLGLGFAAKLYPLILLPTLAIYYWVNGSYRSLFKVLIGLGVAVSLAVLPFLYIGMGQWVEAAVMSGRISLFPSFLHGYQLHGLQIESIPAGIILLGHILGFTPVIVVSEFQGFYIASPIADTVLKWLPTLAFLEFTVVVIACLNCFRNEFKQFGTVTNESLLAFLMSALLILIVAGRILSPQYFGWLLPFAPFLRLRQIGLVAAIFALTIVIYPFSYDSLLALQTPPILLLNVRNFLTIVLLMWIVTERLSASNTPVTSKTVVYEHNTQRDS